MAAKETKEQRAARIVQWRLQRLAGPLELAERQFRVHGRWLSAHQRAAVMAHLNEVVERLEEALVPPPEPDLGQFSFDDVGAPAEATGKGSGENRQTGEW
jgi:hypothetical protein